MDTQSTNEGRHSLAPRQIYRIREVIRITGLGRSTLYAYIAAGKFPRPLRLGVRAVGWSSDAVFQWLAERDIAG
jgi:prophage regulatory protein